MDFAPKQIIKSKNSDGSTSRLEVWDFASLATLELIPLLISILAMALLSSLASMILLVFCLVGLNNRFFNVLGIIVGGYFLYDCEQGWVVMTIVSFLSNDATVNVLYGLTMGTVVAHLIMLIFNKGNLYLMIIIVFAGLFIGTSIHEKGWVAKNRAVKEEPVVYDTRTPEQINKEYEDTKKAEEDRYDEYGNYKK